MWLILLVEIPVHLLDFAPARPLVMTFLATELAQLRLRILEKYIFSQDAEMGLVSGQGQA